MPVSGRQGAHGGAGKDKTFALATYPWLPSEFLELEHSITYGTPSCTEYTLSAQQLQTVAQSPYYTSQYSPSHISHFLMASKACRRARDSHLHI